MNLNKNNASPLQVAINLIHQKRFIEAEALLEKLVKAHRNNADIWHLLSVVQKSLNKEKSCKLSVEKALKFNPMHTAALVNKGKLLETETKYQQAIACYQKVLSKLPNDTNALFNCANALNKVGKVNESKTLLLKLTTISNSHHDAKILLAQIESNLKNYQQAEQFLREILVASPTHYIALNNLASLYKTQCHWFKAIETYQTAHNCAPNINVKTKILKNIATCHTLLGDFDSAINIYNECISINGEDEDAHHWLNQILWENKDPSFLNSYNVQIAKKANPALMTSMAKKLRLAKRLEEAEAILIETNKLFPKEQKTLIELGEVQRELEKFETSLTSLQKAKSIRETELALEQVGIAHLSLGDGKKALNCFNKVLKKNPDQQGWLAYKSTALRLLGSAEYEYLCNYQDHILIAQLPTPQGYDSIDSFNKALLECLREYHRTQTHPLEQSLVGGTQTLEKLFDYHAPIVQQLKEALHEQSNQWLSGLKKDSKHPFLRRISKSVEETDSWSVILKSEGFHKNHFHPAGWLSGPYYVKLPLAMDSSESNEGCIEMGKPGFKSVTPLKAQRILRPQTGMLVQFPSFMWHGTIPFNSNDERVTVAYDVLPKEN